MAGVDTGEGWKSYNQGGFISSDETLLAMLNELVNTIHMLEHIYGINMASLITRGMLNDWTSLSNMAFARRISYDKVPRP